MKSIVDHITEVFPSFSSELTQALINFGKLTHIKEGEELMSIGGNFKTIPLIVEGSIKVVREDSEGNELFLYYLAPGQTCAMSVNCSLMLRPSEVNATAEEDSILIAIPGDKATEWIGSYPEWRNFVFGTYQMRFQEMLFTIDGIAFKQLDTRLLEYLQENAKVHSSNEIQRTHQEIAYDLNSSREVVSRILKILEKNGHIKLGRNKIVLM